MNSFKILQKDGKARVGKLVTPHGAIETPEFNPVGTQATVKALSSRDLKEIGVQMVLANTYHLMLRPGADLIVAFDDHEYMQDEEHLKRSLRLTEQWAIPRVSHIDVI